MCIRDSDGAMQHLQQSQTDIRGKIAQNVTDIKNNKEAIADITKKGGKIDTATTEIYTILFVGSVRCV